MRDRSTAFDSEFLRRLEGLSLRLRRPIRSTGRGDRRSRRRGASPEFAEHRGYQPGDDLRRIDWAAYARTESLFLKLYAGEQDLVAHILIDSSASMGVGTKLDHARRCAAAFAYLALAGGDRVRLQAFGGGRLGAATGPLRGKARLMAVLEFLDEVQASGATSLAEETRRFCLRGPQPGIVAVFSDLLDKAGALEALERLRYAGFDPLVIHTLTREELDPQLSGEQEFSCVETGARVSVTLDRSARRLYRERLQAFLGELRNSCQRQQIGYVLAPDDLPVETLFLELLRHEGIVA